MSGIVRVKHVPLQCGECQFLKRKNLCFIANKKINKPSAKPEWCPIYENNLNLDIDEERMKVEKRIASIIKELEEREQ